MNALANRRFEVLKSKLSFGAAVEIMQDDLLPDFWDSCALNEWLQIYNALPDGKPLKNRARDVIHDLAKDLDSWLEIFRQVPADSELHDLAINQLRTFSLNFEDLYKAYTAAGDDEAQCQDIITKMFRMASSPEQKLVLFSLLPENSIQRDELLDSLNMSNFDYDDWQQLRRTADHKAIKQLATRKMAETASALDELIEVYGDSESNSPLEATMLEKIRALDLPFDDWENAAENASDDKLEALLHEKMAATAVDPEDLVSLYNSAADDQEDLKKQLAARIESAEGSFSDWYDIYTNLNSDSEAESLVAKKTIAAAEDYDDLNSILENGDETEWDETTLQLLADKLKAVEADLEQWKEMDSNVSDKDNPVTRIIHEKMLASATEIGDLVDLYSEAPARSEFRQLVADKIHQTELTFEDVKNAYDNANQGSPEADLLLEKMTAIATDLPDLVCVCGEVASNSKAEKTLLNKIREIDASFSDLKEASDELDDTSSTVGKCLLEKMIGKATEFEDLVTLYADLPKGSKLIKSIQEKINGLELDFDEAFSSFDDLDDDDKESEIGEILLKKMISLTDELEDLKKIYDNSEEHDQVRKEVRKKISTLEVKFVDWHDIVDEISDADDDLTALALEKMMALAGDHDDLAAVFAHSPDGSPLRPKIQKKLQQVQLTKSQWNKIRKTADDNDCDELTEFVDEQLEKLEK
jgi:hypothetical protein